MSYPCRQLWNHTIVHTMSACLVPRHVIRYVCTCRHFRGTLLGTSRLHLDRPRTWYALIMTSHDERRFCGRVDGVEWQLSWCTTIALQSVDMEKSACRFQEGQSRKDRGVRCAGNRGVARAQSRAVQCNKVVRIHTLTRETAAIVHHIALSSISQHAAINQAQRQQRRHHARAASQRPALSLNETPPSQL